jgi:ADP-ribose pyrophosphatase YjhB (NUDIX family)
MAFSRAWANYRHSSPRGDGSDDDDRRRSARRLQAMKFCSNCAAPVVRRVPPGDALPRFVCDQCGEIHYQNPKLVVGTLPEWEGRVLLCRRAIEPRYGYWTLPAGFMENDESAGDGALRETQEEAGARIELIGAYTLLSVPMVNQVHLFYRARLLDLEFAPGEESLEVALFEEAEMPWTDIAFRTVGLTLRHWFADRASGDFRFHAEDVKPR